MKLCTNNNSCKKNKCTSFLCNFVKKSYPISIYKQKVKILIIFENRKHLIKELSESFRGIESKKT